MHHATEPDPFTVDDLRELSRLVLERWTVGADRDWRRARAGTLDWDCLYTADHLIDCVFSYAFFLASRKTDDYPNFGELHALEGAGPNDMIEGLRAVTTMLLAVIETAEPDATAVIVRRPEVPTGGPLEFAARGALEMILHAHDVCSGLGIEPTSDPWADLLVRSGRPAGSDAG